MVYTSIAASIILISASAASAFVQHAPTPRRTLAPLHVTEAFQRSLLASRLGSGAAVAPAAKDASAVDADEEKREQEKFQRSLLEAKLANDAIVAALAANPAAEAVESEPEPAPAVEVEKGPVAVVQEEPAAIVEDEPTAVVEPETEPEPAPESEPELEPEPATLEPVAAVIPEPEPTAPEPEPATPEPEVAAAAPEPEPHKPVIPEPVEVPKPPRIVTPTEFTVPRELAIVPVNEATVQFTAGALGAAAGLALGGPILAALGAASFNYLSRKEEDRGAGSGSTSAKKVVDTASQTALLAYNFLAQFEKQNKVLDSILGLMEKVVDKAKESDSSAGDALVAVESALGGIANKVEELDDEYDLVGGAGTVLDTVGDLVETGLDKVAELNSEYRITDRVGGVVKGAVDKVADR